jgi:DNA-binding MarR family transcriptional regulator
MFLLNELPDRQTLKEFAQRFPEMEVETTAACLRILKVASTLFRELELHFSEHGLSQARFLALILLEREPSRRLMPVEISRKMGTSKKNTARLLALMEEDGLITQADHQVDARATLVKITSKGAKLLTASMPGYYRVLNKAMRPLDEKSKASLSGLLDRML